MKYRKKPVVIEAVKVEDVIRQSQTEEHLTPEWVREALGDRTLLPWFDGSPRVHVPTLEGDMAGNSDDWIIRGVKGELYPCKPDIFEATYDAVEEPEEGPGTMTVRVAVAVDPNGKYAARGGSWGEDDWSKHDSLLESLEFGEARYWLTAELPLPSPHQEVEASVEEVRDVQ